MKRSLIGFLLGVLAVALSVSGCGQALYQPAAPSGEADDVPSAAAGQLSLAGISLGTAVELVEQRLGTPRRP